MHGLHIEENNEIMIAKGDLNPIVNFETILVAHMRERYNLNDRNSNGSKFSCFLNVLYIDKLGSFSWPVSLPSVPKPDF